MYPRIRSLREDSDLNQTEVATLLGMSQTGYSKYETGENDIPTSILISLSAMYDVSIDYLLGISDVKASFPRNTKSLTIFNKQRECFLHVVENKRKKRGIDLK